MCRSLEPCQDKEADEKLELVQEADGEEDGPSLRPPCPVHLGEKALLSAFHGMPSPAYSARFGRSVLGREVGDTLVQMYGCYLEVSCIASLGGGTAALRTTGPLNLLDVAFASGEKHKHGAGE